MATWVNPLLGRITSRYGPRWGSQHLGTDIAPASGQVWAGAALAGTVRNIRTGSYKGDRRSGALVGRTGNGVVLDHGIVNGVHIWTYYGHLATVIVSPGQSVAAGQPLGRVGTTGNSTGVHLHFEIHLGSLGLTTNPEPYMRTVGATLGVGRTSTGQTNFPVNGSIPAQMKASNAYAAGKATRLPFTVVIRVPASR